MTEVLYTVRQLSDRAWDMAVWEEGRDRPKDVYAIRGSKCWCPSYKDRCKHLDILDKFRCDAVGFRGGAVYDLESDTFTTLFGQEK